MTCAFLHLGKHLWIIRVKHLNLSLETQQYHSHYWSNKSYNDVYGVNQALSSLHEGSLEITLSYTFKTRNLEKDRVQYNTEHKNWIVSINLQILMLRNLPFRFLRYIHLIFWYLESKLFLFVTFNQLSMLFSSDYNQLRIFFWFYFGVPYSTHYSIKIWTIFGRSSCIRLLDVTLRYVDNNR